MVTPPKKAPRIVDPLSTPPASTEAELTPEQKKIAELEHRLAVALGRKVSEVDRPVEYEEPATESDDVILIHFVEDGWTWGQVWLRGQELEFKKGSPAFEETKGRNGRSWVTYTEEEQLELFDTVYFRPGPWRGKSYLDVKYEALKALQGDGKVELPGINELAAAEAKEKARRRAAPRLPQI